MTLYTVRLELARTKDFPEGNARRGYEFVAPLDQEGHLDAEEWRRNKARCVVNSFAEGKDGLRGKIIHIGKGWHFDYDAKTKDDDEPLFKLDRHNITEGEYVSVTEHDGVSRPFKIISVKVFP